MALGLTPYQIIEKGTHPQLVIADEWERVELKKIASVQNGYAFSSKLFNRAEGMPLIRIRDIFSVETENLYSGEYKEDFVVNKGDILIGMDGDFKVSKWPGDKGLLNQRVCRIHFDSAYYEKEFLFICIQPYLNAIHSETSAVTVKHLSSRTINDIPFPLPTLPEQRAIVSKIEELFSDLDNGIADLNKAQNLLKIYRQAVLKKAFEKLTNETTLEEIKEDSLIGLVRASGLQNNIGEGTAYLKMDKIDMIGNINLEGLVYVETNEEEIEKYSLKTGDILLNTRNSYELVGKTGVIRNIKETVVFNNNIMRIRVKNGFDPLFVCYQLISPFVRKQMEEYKKATTSVCALYQRNLFPLKLKTTSLEEQHQIVQEIESRLSVCDKVEQSITESLEKAKALRQSILKKAFEGTLLTEEEIAECKAAPDYEPASVLLEKIKAEKKKP